MEFTVREINWQDESAWDEHWRVANLVSREVAGQSAWQLTSEQAAERVRTTPNRSYCYLNATVDGLTVGAGRLRTVLDDEPAHSFLDISVLPEFRRVGIGAALAAGLLEAARSHGSRRIDAFVMAHRCNPAVAEGALALADHLGMRVNAIEDVRELELPRSWDRPKTPGYTFEVVTGSPRPELFDDLRVLQQAMNTDVPQGEVALPIEEWTDERLAARFRADDELLWLVFARDADGRVAGYTELGNPDLPGVHHLLQQGDTVVLPEHRGHGLGRALKVHAMSSAQADAPWLTRAQTSNDDTNTHMIAINDWLGFEVVARTWNRTLVLDTAL